MHLVSEGTVHVCSLGMEKLYQRLSHLTVNGGYMLRNLLLTEQFKTYY